MARKNDFILKIDQRIGEKIYMLRLAHGFSRQQLATIIGVTHQQLQKYEKGTNRISAGRLILIARALSTDIAHFYLDLDQTERASPVTQHQRMCIELSRNFMKIESPQHQDAVNALVKSLVKAA